MAGADNGLVTQEAGHESSAGDAVSRAGVDGGGGFDRVSAGENRRAAHGVVGDLIEQSRAATALIESLRDLVGDDEEIIATAVEGETNLHEAICRAFNRLAELNALMNGIAGMIADLKDRGDRFEAQRDRIREAISMAMEAAQIKRLELPLGTISLKSTPPKVIVANEAEVPAHWFKQAEPKLDRAGLLKALKDGHAIPGATLSNGGTTIQVKFS